MGTGDVDFAFLEPAKSELAGSGGGDDLHAADLFHHPGEQAGGRIAPG